MHKDPSITGSSKIAEDEFRLQYPAVYNHLLFHKDGLLKRNKAEVGIRYEWYALQRWGANYTEDFFSEKIVYPDIMRLPKKHACMDEYPYFYFDNKNYLAEATNFIMTGSHLHSIFSILTSRLGTLAFTHFYSGPQFDEKGYRYKKEYIQNMPLPNSMLKYNSTFQNILDNITNKIHLKLDHKKEIRTIENMVNDIYELNGQEKDYLNKKVILTDSKG